MDLRADETNGEKTTNEQWLIGETSQEIFGTKLPSNRQVMSVFLHFHREKKNTISLSADLTVEEVLRFWETAEIPTKKDYHMKEQIKKLHSKWLGLKKNRLRNTETQRHNTKVFEESLDDLFDVAHADTHDLVTQKIYRFLLNQRKKGKQGYCERLMIEERNRERNIKHHEVIGTQNEPNEVVSQGIISSSSGITLNQSSNEVYRPLLPKKQKKTTQLMSTILSATLDRTKTSDRNATFVLAATAHSLGHNINNVVLSRETVRRQRRNYRSRLAKEIRDSFCPDSQLTVHWDGKLLPDLIATNKSVDRLAVLVSGQGVIKLLGVPPLKNGTGVEQANAVFELIPQWNLTDRVQAMCFDTTASNTGIKAGACTLLEDKLDKKLLGFACRHHVMELIVGAVFNELFEPSSGPNIKLFQRFKSHWDQINKDNFEGGIDEASDVPKRDEIIEFIRDQMTMHHPRDDYKELLQLALVYLGGSPASGVRILALGAFHRARWMAKVNYCLKIYIFRAQLKLKASELKGLRALNLFVIQVYLKVWYTSPCPETAPQNDLQLLKDLVDYTEVDRTVASTALKTFSRHLWYLNEYLIGLAFFDTRLPTSSKIEMVSALHREGTDAPPPRIKIAAKDIPKKSLSDFVTQNTKYFFTALKIPDGFLQMNPDTWHTNDDFLKGQSIVRGLKVVNDAAERGVASFNSSITADEEQKQFLLQVVEEHRRSLPNANKSSLVQNFSAI